jgi:glycopeptide antibiotics resistance protein
MSNPFGEVSAPPIVIPLALVLFAVLLLRLHARRIFSIPRASVAAALSVYAAGIVGNTVFPIFVSPPPGREPWMPALALIPFFDYEVEDAVVNLLVFVPMGALISLLLARPSRWRVLTITAGVSLSIELAQLAAQRMFGGGHVADINDFIFNVVGGALGYGLFIVLLRIPPIVRFVDRFRWTQPAEPASVS